MDKKYLRTNQKMWDARTKVHVTSEYYDVVGFKAGNSTLKGIETGELGDIQGKSLLHLMCHFGLDTLSLARLGTDVTGVDFSGEAVRTASALAAELNIPARFIQSDVYKLDEVLQEQFDIVFTSYGVLAWLSDLATWAKLIAKFLKPGGFFYIAEIHPFTYTVDDELEKEEIRLTYPYFPSPEPEKYTNETSYTGQTFAEAGGMDQYEWAHSISEIINALIKAGLRIEFLHEFPYTVYPAIPIMQQGDDGYYHLPDGLPKIPWLFSLKASK